jgi:hypothetical protein
MCQVKVCNLRAILSSNVKNDCQKQSLVRLVERKINKIEGSCTIISETHAQSLVRLLDFLQSFMRLICTFHKKICFSIYPFDFKVKSENYRPSKKLLCLILTICFCLPYETYQSIASLINSCASLINGCAVSAMIVFDTHRANCQFHCLMRLYNQ